jgi:hypothetical protein
MKDWLFTEQSNRVNFVFIRMGFYQAETILFDPASR